VRISRSALPAGFPSSDSPRSTSPIAVDALHQPRELACDVRAHVAAAEPRHDAFRGAQLERAPHQQQQAFDGGIGRTETGGGILAARREHQLFPGKAIPLEVLLAGGQAMVEVKVDQAPGRAVQAEMILDRRIVSGRGRREPLAAQPAEDLRQLGAGAAVHEDVHVGDPLQRFLQGAGCS
jgi:hypothetical protein